MPYGQHIIILAVCSSLWAPSQALRLETHGKRLQILGMFDSGTDFLTQLLTTNLGEETMSRVCPGPKKWRKVDTHCAKNDCPKQIGCNFFTHEMPEALLKHNLTDIVVVALVRSPLSQLASWFSLEESYELTKCVKDTHWLSASEGQHTECDIKGELFEDPVAVWNEYVRSYTSLAARWGAANVHVIEYERLVMQPEETIRSIAHALGEDIQIYTPDKTFDDVTRPRPLETLAAMDKISNHRYMNSPPWTLDEAYAKNVCQRLDALEMQKFRVPLTPVEDYAADCEKVSLSKSMSLSS